MNDRERSEMKVSDILAHPHKGSFNHAIADTVVRVLEENGHVVIFHDLYKERFNPVLPYAEISRNAPLPPIIAQHCTEIAAADGIIFVHPDWWGMPPVILKGWIDRVRRPGVTYRFLDGDKGEGIPDGLLKAKAALVFNTSNTPRERAGSLRRPARTALEGLYLLVQRRPAMPPEDVWGCRHEHWWATEGMA
jgi:NAD(P)H dehydrogenase (quinone)